MTSYPSSIFDPRTVENIEGVVYEPSETTRVFAEDVNLMADEVVAIQETLGTDPQGSYSSVVERLDSQIAIDRHIVPYPFNDTTSSTYDFINYIYMLFNPSIYTEILSMRWHIVYQQYNSGSFLCSCQLYDVNEDPVADTEDSASLAQFAVKEFFSPDIKDELGAGLNRFLPALKVASGGSVGFLTSELIVEYVV